jgi:formate dehydrogenase iron-sulfur subunit
VGFFTDPTVCIGCKACEVACKEWNGLPAREQEWLGRSYDNTGSLGNAAWRHVKFLEQDDVLGLQLAGPMSGEGEEPFRWLFLSDVCKHCGEAGCLESCPTGAIVRTEIGSVYIQDDICNGCGYCIVTCPFGVIDRRPKEMAGAGGAFKCTFCYDRQKDGLVPACAKVCPTESIQYGALAEMRQRAEARARALREEGVADAAVYDPIETSLGGTHAVFLHFGEPEAFGLPRKPESPQIHLDAAWFSALVTVAGAFILTLVAFALG